MSEIDEKFAPLMALAKDKARRNELLELENLRLAARFKNKHPKEYSINFLGFLSAWAPLPTFKAEVTRRSAAAKRAREEDEKQQEAMARLAKADAEGLNRIAEGHPVGIARDFITQVRPNLMHMGGEWLDFVGNHYAAFEKGTIRADLQRWMDNAVNAETGKKALVNRKVLDDVMDAVANLCHRSVDTTRPPSWLEPEEGDPDPGALLACSNGLVNVYDPAAEPMANTPRFFTRNGLPYPYEDPFFVLPPYRFLRFLDEVWPEAEGGKANHDALQEWFGHLLTSSAKFQKILLLMGASRAGKGVLLKIINALVGERNIAETQFRSLRGEFGPSMLVGKSVMIVPDLRLDKDSGPVIELLLSISGGDRISINRKFKEHLSERLPIRIVLATNVELTVPDQSGAFANRLFPLVFTKDFFGREDPTLADTIIANELPGILQWAMEGLRRLEARKAFVLPPESVRRVQAIRHQAGTVDSFIKERCELVPGYQLDKRTLFRAFEAFCEDFDIPNRYLPETFGREMMRSATQFRVTTDRATIDGRQVRVYTGIKLKDEWAADGEDDPEDY